MADEISQGGKRSLESFLESVGACSSCIQRWKRSITNSAAEESLTTSPAAKRLRSEPQTETDTAPLCPLCLGMLQKCTKFAVDLTPASLTEETLCVQAEGGIPPSPPLVLSTFPSLNEALDALRATWEFDTFALEVSLPAAFAVRHQAAWWTAQDAVPAEELPPSVTAIRDVREAVRTLYTNEIKQVIGIEPDQASTMRITVGCTLAPEITSEAAWLAAPPAKLGRKQRFLNKQKGENAKHAPQRAVLASPAIISKLAGMPRPEFLEKCPPAAAALSKPQAVPVLVLTPHRKPVYIGGRYLKLSRGLPQSPWIMDGVRRGESSVEEEIANIVLPSLGADGYSFISSGREDIDVRMLGNGRPFALEVRNARVGMPGVEAGKELAAAVAARGKGVEILGLQGLGSEAVMVLKQGEQDKRKSYAAVCWIPQAATPEIIEKLNFMGQDVIEIDQWTPVRVLHRRANACRRRAVHAMSAEVLPGRPEGYFLLRLTTAAGTYVKEFVHGDRGRTKPSIKEILGVDSAECVYLDVTGVELDFLPEAGIDL